MRVLIFAVLALSLAFGLAQVFGVGLTCDTDLFMHQSLMMWRGEGMYTRIIQINAPFNIMVYAPLAAFAAHFNLSPARVLHGFAFIVSLIGLVSLNHALKFHGVAKEDRSFWCAGGALLLFVTTPMLQVFGDREHLLFAFALPWILQMLLRYKPLPYTAVLGGIGFCMRPHNVILFGVLTLVGGPKEWSLSRRLFSASSLIIGAIMGAYALSVIVFFPDYLTKMVPIGSLIYTAGQVTMQRKFELGAPLIVLMCMGLLAFIREQRFIWSVFFVTVVLIFLLNSGWGYTFNWLVAPLVLIYVAPWCSPFKEHFRCVEAVRAASAALLLLLMATGGVYLQKQMESMRKTGTALAHHHLPRALTADLRAVSGNGFILLSPMLWNIDIEPFNGTPRSVFGFDVEWPLYWLFKHESDPYFTQVLHFATDPLLLALKTHPDATVIVDTSPKLRNFGGDGQVLEFLERNPEVKAEMASYALDKKLDYCTATKTLNCRFDIWRRR